CEFQAHRPEADAPRVWTGRRSVPQRSHSIALLLATLFAWLGSTVCSAQSRPNRLTEKVVDASVVKAVEFLKKQRQPWNHWEASEKTGGDVHWGGDSALVLLALLTAGESPRDDAIAKDLDWLVAQPSQSTYVYSLRAQVLSLADVEKHKKQLASDLDWLVTAARASGPNAGAYSYRHCRVDNIEWFDNSNSQFGVLGVWSALEGGARNDALGDYWTRVAAYWVKSQLGDGGWSYQNNAAATRSMTAAGLSSVFIALDQIATRGDAKQTAELATAADRALDWFGRNFTYENTGGSQWTHYYHYGVERAGRASGRKYFQSQDWFQTIGTRLVASQRDDGGWGDGKRDTAFATLFLCHGRAPIFINKLEYGEDWNRHLRDAASIARHASRTFERLFNWQSISLETGTVDDLLESPILYLSGDAAWELDDDHRAKLIEYVRRGGMLLAIADRPESRFVDTIRAFCNAAYPDLTLRAIDRQHPLIGPKAQFPIDQPPEMLELHNGVRTVLLLVMSDVAETWHRGQSKQKPTAFSLGCNLYGYATDRTTLRSRLSNITPELEPADIRRTIRIARIKHAGDWDIEPYGWQRFAAYMNNNAHTRVEVADGVALDAPELSEFKIAHITGTRSFKLAPEEIAGLRRFLADGGTLLADPAMGSIDFLGSFEDQISQLVAEKPARLPDRSPILQGDKLDDAGKLSKVEYRRSVRGQLRGREFPPIRGIAMGERYAVLFTPLDLSVSMLGTPVWECPGFATIDAMRVMRNMVLYANLSTAEKAKIWDGGKSR
ncbi:MAG: DUF4159 domain-containing protein, partial [Phycisphaerae bacterium]